MKRYRTYIVIFCIVLFIALWSVVLLTVGPEIIVEKIGVENVYLIIFLSGVLGGLSSLTVAPFFASVITASAGGADPLLLAIFGGVALTLSDGVFYYLAYKGRDILARKFQFWADKIKRWMSLKPRWFPQALCFAYTGFTPFPTDILMVSMALALVPFRRIIFFVYVGNTAFLFITSMVASVV